MTYRNGMLTSVVTVAFLIPAGLSFAQTPARGAAVCNLHIDVTQYSSER
jgi:hypothetical protein